MYERKFRQWDLTKNSNKYGEKRILHGDLGKGRAASIRRDSSDGNNVKNSRPAQYPSNGCSSAADEGNISDSFTICSGQTGPGYGSDINFCGANHTSSGNNIDPTSSEHQLSHVMSRELSGQSEDSSYSSIEHHSEAWSTTRSPSPTEGQNSDLLPLILFNPEKTEAFGGVDLELILKSVQSYLSYLDRVRVNPVCPPNDFTQMDGEYFWDQLSYGIYLFKVASNELAWNALSKACDRACTAIQWEDPRAMGKLLTTLSPVNTAVCPEVRHKLLDFIGSMAKCMFGSCHPFTVICQQLRHDEKSREVSERVLRFMLDLLLCSQGSNSASTIQTQRMLIKSMRRGKDYSNSLRRAKELISISSQCWGNEHQETQRARREFEHILMDMGEWDKALAVCLSIVHADNRQRTGTTLIEDECVVNTMEDIGKIYENQGDLNSSVVWLLRAATSEWTTSTGGVAAAHIVDKLLSALQRAGRDDEAVFWEDHFRGSRQL
ncbi:MAG: hypothetical protein Q9166_005378 [cf. Caloplaca sp. 2 TL-2023]